MLTFLFSYYQIMASFLDFISPFGKQEHAEDSHFSAVKEDIRLDSRHSGLKIRELGRSGLEIRIGYNLRSVERSPGQKDFPWSIRQTAVYHSFDLETAHTLWVNFKGNKLLKKRVEEVLASSDAHKIGSCSQAFTTSLQQHVLFCDWSGENWRWYINYLETELHKMSRNALAVPVNNSAILKSHVRQHICTDHCAASCGIHVRQSSDDSRDDPQLCLPRYQSKTSPSVRQESPSESTIDKLRGSDWALPARRSYKFLKLFIGPTLSTLRYNRLSSLLSGQSDLTDHSSTSSLTPVAETPGLEEKSDTKRSPNATQDAQQDQWNPQDKNSCAEAGNQASSEESFTIRDLQRMHYIEEQLQEANLVLRMNIENLHDLRQLYSSISSHQGFPTKIKSSCGSDLADFDRRVLGVEKDHRTQLWRTETILQLLNNRKGLLHDIIQYQNMRANELSAKKAQSSADKMEVMTTSMHEIARKTNQETVSMRVITSVTLFFLPGTFVATIMSTDIIRFVDKKSVFQLKGLRIYLAISIPMMMMTFLAWYIVYRVERRRDRLINCTIQGTKGSNRV
ncbi:uncharacterized protein BDR25DRAFT_128515 [Lindgomyces ingoldianus]|uniref:Uncharacterized protein n=1 Tax=Lindgomyces ingoldianus TaxID=673940 RepID=A0ACB6R2P7_9PLEO|nr:uncharacterized protein BDR25DRAFT_128515 [Lindgomyces ingoldianus]KAF2473093.1 hypothetical protein BDR25DRAFT_128515 [Lindgomyces ingoldianus]